jgi:hypothetical protein
MRLECTEDPDPPDVCFPSDISVAFGIFAGVWGILVATTGILGNLLTLTAIPYAAKHRRSALNISVQHFDVHIQRPEGHS